MGTPVDDRQHGVVTHLALAISARDLLEQVKAPVQMWSTAPYIQTRCALTSVSVLA